MATLIKKSEIKRQVVSTLFSRNNGAIIGKLDNGKIAIITYGCNFIPAPGELWECVVIKNLERKCIVEPLFCLKTKEELESELKSKIQELSIKGIAHETKPPKQKNAVLYYASK
jgi:hypothetical protein